jgi:hypothetical protein
MMLVMGSCATLGPLNTKQIVRHNHDGVAKMTRVMHFMDGSEAKSSCTVFHIGQEQMLTAAHCFDPLYLILHEDKLLGPGVQENFDHKIIDSHGHEYTSFKILKYNFEHDLVLMSVPKFDGRGLAIWNPVFDGEPEVGSQIIALGYPGYFATKFTFETGLLKAIDRIQTGLGADGPFIISKGTLFPGYSGGPTLSMDNGKVIGLNHAGATIPVFRGRDVVSLSLAISYDTIRRFLDDDGSGDRLKDTHIPTP